MEKKYSSRPGYLQRRKSNVLDSSIIDSFKGQSLNFEDLNSLIADIGQERLIDECGIVSGETFSDALYAVFRYPADKVEHELLNTGFLSPAAISNLAIDGLLNSSVFQSCPWLLVPLVIGGVDPSQLGRGDAVTSELQMYLVGAVYASAQRIYKKKPSPYDFATFLYELVKRKKKTEFLEFLQANTESTETWDFFQDHAIGIYTLLPDSEKNTFEARMFNIGFPVTNSIPQSRVKADLRIELYELGQTPVKVLDGRVSETTDSKNLVTPVRAFLGGLNTCRTAVYYKKQFWRVCIEDK